MAFESSFQSSPQYSQIFDHIQHKQNDFIIKTQRLIDITQSDEDYFTQIFDMHPDLWSSGISDNLSEPNDGEDEKTKQSHFVTPSSGQTSSRDDNDGRYSQVLKQIRKRNVKLLKDKNISRVLINKFYKFLTQTQSFSKINAYFSNKLAREKTDYKKLILENKNQFCSLQDLENVFGLQPGIKDPEERSKVARRIAYEIFQDLGVRDELEDIQDRKDQKIITKKELQKIKKIIFHLKIFKLRCRSPELISRIQII